MADTTTSPEVQVLNAIKEIATKTGDWAVPKIRIAITTDLPIDVIDRAIFKLEERGVMTVQRPTGRASVYTLRDVG